MPRKTNIQTRSRKCFCGDPLVTVPLVKSLFQSLPCPLRRPTPLARLLTFFPGPLGSVCSCVSSTLWLSPGHLSHWRCLYVSLSIKHLLSWGPSAQTASWSPHPATCAHVVHRRVPLSAVRSGPCSWVQRLGQAHVSSCGKMGGSGVFRRWGPVMSAALHGVRGSMWSVLMSINLLEMKKDNILVFISCNLGLSVLKHLFYFIKRCNSSCRKDKINELF